MIAGEVLSLMGRHRTSQKALSAALGMKQSSLSARLNCQVPWKVDELEGIARYFDIPVTQLLGVPPLTHRKSDPTPLTSVNACLGQLDIPFDTPARSLSLVSS